MSDEEVFFLGQEMRRFDLPFLSREMGRVLGLMVCSFFLDLPGVLWEMISRLL